MQKVSVSEDTVRLGEIAGDESLDVRQHALIRVLDILYTGHDNPDSEDCFHSHFNRNCPRELSNYSILPFESNLRVSIYF